MPNLLTRRKAGMLPAGLKKAIAWLRYHPMSTDVVGLSMVAVVLIWGALK